MLESLRQKITEVQARIDENERLVHRLSEVYRALQAEAAWLAQLKAQLVRHSGEPAASDRLALADVVRHQAEPPDLKKKVLEFLDAAVAHVDHGRVTSAAQHPEARVRPAGAAPSPLRPQAAATKPLVAGHPEPPSVDSRVLDYLAVSGAEADQARAAGLPLVATKARPTPAEYARARQQVAEGKRDARAAAASASAAAHEPSAVSSRHAEPEPAVVAETAAPAEPAAEPPPSPAPAPPPAAEEAHAAADEPAGPDAELRDDQERLSDALEAGRAVLTHLDRCIELLEGVTRGGTLHTISSAVFSRSPDHAHLDEARQEAREAQAALRRFHEQGAGLKHRLGEKKDVDELAALADRLLEHLAGESQEGPGILHSIRAARTTYHEIRQVCTHLQREGGTVRARLAALARHQHRLARRR
jgi:hypothetical protein